MRGTGRRFSFFHCPFSNVYQNLATDSPHLRSLPLLHLLFSSRFWPFYFHFRSLFGPLLFFCHCNNENTLLILKDVLSLCLYFPSTCTYHMSWCDSDLTLLFWRLTWKPFLRWTSEVTMRFATRPLLCLLCFCCASCRDVRFSSFSPSFTMTHWLEVTHVEEWCSEMGRR